MNSIPSYMKSTNIKQRYELLDGLRGVAALMVIIYHVFECFPMETWIIGHGYLAVDFFFILSGFVIGYAYDDRWGKGGMTFGQFAKRRLIRLHPMVVFGVVIGLVCFLIQGAEGWDGTKATTSAIMISTLLALFLIPNAPGGIGEVRGNGEMFPLNGPHWSLFFEYIGNILYGLLIRRFSTKTLAIWTGILGVFFVRFFLSDPAGYGNIGYGWTLADNGFIAGLLRMLFSYSIGLLLCRVFKPMKIRGAFWICTLIIIVFLSIPMINIIDGASWDNSLYEILCVIVVFPAVVWIAASGTTSDRRSTAICDFLGQISYPIYAIHYPSMYLFYKYIGFPETWRTPSECWPVMVALVVGNVILAYIILKLYDLPVRKWLTKKIIDKQ